MTAIWLSPLDAPPDERPARRGAQAAVGLAERRGGIRPIPTNGGGTLRTVAEARQDAAAAAAEGPFP